MVTRALPGECPFEKSPAEEMTRRTWARFVMGAIVGSVATLLYPVLRYVTPPAEAAISANEALAGTVGELMPNSGKTFRFGSKPALLVRLATGEYRSMSAVCTHLGCTVQYRPESKQIWCACHNGC